MATSRPLLKKLLISAVPFRGAMGMFIGLTLLAAGLLALLGILVGVLAALGSGIGLGLVFLVQVAIEKDVT